MTDIISEIGLVLSWAQVWARGPVAYIIAGGFVLVMAAIAWRIAKGSQTSETL